MSEVGQTGHPAMLPQCTDCPGSSRAVDVPERQVRADFVAEIGDQNSEAADAIF